MDSVLILLMVALAWQVLRVRYQRARIACWGGIWAACSLSVTWKR